MGPTKIDRAHEYRQKCFPELLNEYCHEGNWYHEGGLESKPMNQKTRQHIDYYLPGFPCMKDFKIVFQ